MQGDTFMRRLLSVLVTFTLAVPVAAQKPVIFDVSNVVVGAQKIQTLYLFAEGKWSDAGEHIGRPLLRFNATKALVSAMWPAQSGSTQKPLLTLLLLTSSVGTLKK